MQANFPKRSFFQRKRYQYSPCRRAGGRDCEWTDKERWEGVDALPFCICRKRSGAMAETRSVRDGLCRPAFSLFFLICPWLDKPCDSIQAPPSAAANNMDLMKIQEESTKQILRFRRYCSANIGMSLYETRMQGLDRRPVVHYNR